MDELESMAYEVIAVSEHFRRTMDGMDREMLRRLEGPVRAEVAGALQKASLSADQVRRTLGQACDFCRKAGGEPLGLCEQCGQAACDKCARVQDGHVLHLGTCMSYFKPAG